MCVRVRVCVCVCVCVSAIAVSVSVDLPEIQRLEPLLGTKEGRFRRDVGVARKKRRPARHTLNKDGNILSDKSHNRLLQTKVEHNLLKVSSIILYFRS